MKLGLLSLFLLSLPLSHAGELLPYGKDGYLLAQFYEQRGVDRFYARIAFDQGGKVIRRDFQVSGKVHIDGQMITEFFYSNSGRDIVPEMDLYESLFVTIREKWTPPKERGEIGRSKFEMEVDYIGFENFERGFLEVLTGKTFEKGEVEVHVTVPVSSIQSRNGGMKENPFQLMRHLGGAVSPIVGEKYVDKKYGRLTLESVGFSVISGFRLGTAGHILEKESPLESAHLLKADLLDSEGKLLDQSTIREDVVNRYKRKHGK